MHNNSGSNYNLTCNFIFFADDACGLLLKHAHVLFRLDSDAVPITSIFDVAIVECLITQEICTYMACLFLFPA